MAAITVSTRRPADGDVRVRVSREDARQFEAFVAAAHHVVSRFEVEEQVVVQPIDRGSGAEGTGDLRNDVRHHFAPVEAGEQPQSEGDRRVEMRAGNGGGQIDGHGDARAPNDADFPLAEAGARQFQRGNAAYAKEDQQRRAEELGDALAF